VSTTGIALGVDQVERATREADRRHLSQSCKFLVADFQCMPFADSCFDVVWAQESLCHALTKADFFHEAYRVLRPGGRLVIADFFLRSQVIAPADLLILKEWLCGWKIPCLWTAAQHANAAKNAGFWKISIEDVTRCTYQSHLRLYKMAVLAMPIAIVLDRIGARNAIQYANVLSSLQQFRALRSDCWFYAILTAQRGP
jgi:tocopherol O-methyltransferase